MQSKKSIQTLCLILKDSKILLGRKTRKLGKGFWNGPGGKLEEGENLQDSIMREVKAETGLNIKNLEQVGRVVVEFEDGSEGVLLHIFLTKDFDGEITDSDEMTELQWFNIERLPLDNMWEDDEFWLPVVLEGKKIEGRFIFDHPSTLENVGRIVSRELREVTGIQQEIKVEEKTPWKIK